MIKHIQSRLHDLENGVAGNCHITCIACLTGIDPELFPQPPLDPYGWEEYLKEIDYFLEKREISVLRIYPTDEILKDLGAHYPNIPMIVGGLSPRGKGRHAVIYLDGKMIHDPHPSGDGIVGDPDYSISIILSHRPWKLNEA
jgi:hypothetical protein